MRRYAEMGTARTGIVGEEGGVGDMGGEGIGVSLPAQKDIITKNW